VDTTLHLLFAGLFASNAPFWDVVFENLIPITIGGLIVGAVAGLLRIGGRKKVAKESAKEQAAKDTADDFAQLRTMTTSIYDALITPPPTPFNPHPEPRLIDTVAEMKTIQHQMDVRLGNVETTLTQNGGTGNTMLDRVTRIESQVGVPAHLTHGPTDLTPHEQAGDEYSLG